MFKVVFVLPFVIVVFAFCFVLGVIPCFLMRMLGLKKISQKWLFWNIQKAASVIMALLGAKFEITGDVEGLKKVLDSQQSVCYVSNHLSILDIPSLVGPLGLNMGFIAKKETSYIPFINLLAVAMHSVFMDRKSLKKSAKSIKKGIANIRKGYPMLIFPEGTRSKTNHVGSFKHGSFKLATESGAVIVPFVLKGTRDLFETRKKFFENKIVRINVLSPVKTEGLDRDGIFDMEQSIEKEVKEIYEQL